MDNQEIIQRARMGDVEAQFDMNLQTATASVTTPGLKALALRPIERRILPAFEREMRLVNPELVALLRSLVAGKTKWPLYLYGPSGSGKTAAALCLCDFAKTAIYKKADDLCDLAKGDDAAAQWERIAGKDLAVLDELGERENVADFHYTTVKRFLDLREERAGRVAVYLSNSAPREIQALYDDRIASRVLCGTWFALTGDDRRFKE